MKKYVFPVLSAIAVVSVVSVMWWLKIQFPLVESLKVIGLLVLAAGLTIVNILLLASFGAYFIKISESTTVFINAGGSLKRILPNVKGYKMSVARDIDNKQWLIPAENEEDWTNAFFRDSNQKTVWFQKWMWETLGVRFFSSFWPQVHVHRFDIRKNGRKSIEARDGLEEDAPLRSRVVNSPESKDKGTVVDHLLFMVPRPVYIEGVELAGDNSRINLLLLPIFKQVVPSSPVYDLKGDFFTLLDAAMEAAVVDFFAKHRAAVYKKGNSAGREEGEFAHNTFDPKAGDPSGIKGDDYEKEYEESPLTYAIWLKLTKAGEGSPLEKRLGSLNVSQEYLRKLEEKIKIDSRVEKILDYARTLVRGDSASTPSNKQITGMIPGGIVPRFGFALVSLRSVEWEAHKDTKNLAEALLAKEIEGHKADGVRQKAEGERDAKVANATGDSSFVNQVMTALKAHNVDANVAAKVLETMIRTKNIGGSQITTYVEGGASASVMVNPSTSTKTTS